MSGHSGAGPGLGFASRSAICSKERKSWKNVYLQFQATPHTYAGHIVFPQHRHLGSYKEIKGRKGDFPMMLVGFWQILQGCDIWTFLPLFITPFLPSPPPMGPIRLPGPAQPYSQNVLPLSCYQRVFGLCVHTCQLHAPTNGWPFEEKLCDGTCTVCLCLFICSPTMHILPELQLSSHFYDRVVWIWTVACRDAMTPETREQKLLSWWEAIGSLFSPW